jgi:hypothetical protein
VSSFECVRYVLRAPSFTEVRGAPEPVFLAPPIGLRSAWRTVCAELVRTPLASLAAYGPLDARGLARFLLWRETARCFGVRSLIGAEEALSTLERLLPTPSSPHRSRPTVGGLLMTRNERPLVERAIRSLAELVDEIVVVDDHSTDGTAELALQLGARVIVRPLRSDFAAQRNAGLAALRTEWVLTIDADEVVEPALVPLLERAASWPGADVVFVPRLNLIVEYGEQPVSWPDFQPKLFRSHLRFKRPLHEQLGRWRQPLFMPLSGPYIVHRKTLARQHRATLLYDRLDPHSPYPPEMIAAVRAELAQLESSQPPADGETAAADGPQATAGRSAG